MGQIELLVTVWITFVTFVASAEPPGGYYQTKYDGLDVENVLNQKRLVHHYAFCLLNRGPCPPQGADLKRIIPDSIQTTCLRCSDKQKVVILKTIRRLRSEYPSLWKELVDYYDPTEAGIRKIEQLIDKELYGNDNDQSNFIGNRFSEPDSGNDLVAPVATDEPPITSSTTKRPSTKPISTSKRPSTKPPTSPSTTRPSTTTLRPVPTYLPPVTIITGSSTSEVPNYPPPTSTTVMIAGSTSKPLAFLPSNNVETVDSTTTTTTTTNRPSVVTRWKLTTAPTHTRPSYGWRPNPAFNIPVIKVDAGIRFLGSVLQAGTEVAGMVLSTVQQVFGRPIN